MIKLMKSTFYEEQLTKDALCEFIASAKQLSMGEQCDLFEKRFADWQGRKYAVLFNSGSSANLALWQAVKNLHWVNESKPVGFSALTWATNVMPLIQLGFDPIPIDVSLFNLNVTLDTLKDEHIEALFLTNALGFSGDIDFISQWCQENNIMLFEDNCESLGSVKGDVKLGNYGVASTFSFYVGHQLSTIEGGMVCTDSNILYGRLKMVRSHGWNRDVDDDFKEQLEGFHGIDDFHSKYTFYCNAYNLRPTEITGFLGNYQLNYIDEIIKQRNDNYNRFFEASYDNPDISKICPRMKVNSNFAYPFILKDKETFLKYKQKAIDADIEIRPMLGGDITRQPFYDFYHRGYKKMENARFISDNGFYLPNNPELTEDEIKTIEGVLRK